MDLARLEKMPDWPARMTAPVAALYMGISHSAFLERYGHCGVREKGNVLWAKRQLDRLIEKQFDLAAPPESPALPANDYDAWKARQGK